MTGRPSNPLPRPPNRIKEVREAKGLTQNWVAERVGVTGESIRKYETGDVAISIFQLERVARALGVPAHTLLNDYIPPSDHETALLSIFKRLSHSDRLQAISLVSWLETQAKTRLFGG